MATSSRKKQIEDMLAEDPNDPFLRYGLAMENVSEGDLEAAHACLLELIRRTPDYVPAYQQAGQVLTRLNRPAEARATYAQGIALARQQGNNHAAEEMTAFQEALTS